MPRTSGVMLEDQNMSCGRRTNSLRSQPKMNGHLVSGELDYLCKARGQDNLQSLDSMDKQMS